MSSTMVCSNCPFLRQCSIGGEHQLIDVDECPLYQCLENNFRTHEERIERQLGDNV